MAYRYKVYAVTHGERTSDYHDPGHTDIGLKQITGDALLFLRLEHIKLALSGDGRKFEEVYFALALGVPLFCSSLYGISTSKKYLPNGSVVYVTGLREYIFESHYSRICDFSVIKSHIWEILEEEFKRIDSKFPQYAGNKVICTGKQFMDFFDGVEFHINSVYEININDRTVRTLVKEGSYVAYAD